MIGVSPTTTMSVLVVGMLGPVIWYWLNATSRGRDRALGLYTSRSSPIWIRNCIALGPVWAVVAGLAFLVTIAPAEAARWLLATTVVVGLAAFAVSYRVPPPFLPSWLREEIEGGGFGMARPYRTDWLLFWLVVPFGVIGAAAIGWLATTM